MSNPQNELTPEQQRYWGFKWFAFPEPPLNSHIQIMRDYVKIHELNTLIRLTGKGRTKIVIWNEIRQYVARHQIPTDVITTILSSLDMKERAKCSCISKFFNKCVFKTNEADRNIKYTFSGSITSGNFIFIFCFFFFPCLCSC